LDLCFSGHGMIIWILLIKVSGRSLPE
jgi:hypothetical protein